MPEPVLTVVSDDRGAATVLRARGVIDHGSRDVLREVAVTALEQGRVRLVADLHQVSLCDSSGLSMLVELHRRAGAGGGWLRLACLRPLVRTALSLTNLDRLLPVYDTVDEALGS